MNYDVTLIKSESEELMDESLLLTSQKDIEDRLVALTYPLSMLDNVEVGDQPIPAIAGLEMLKSLLMF